MDLVLIRHGQSHNNAIWAATGRSLGRLPDPPLTDVGRAQAKQLAQAVGAGDLGVQPTIVYASLMTRAIQTAAPLADVLDLPIQAHPEAFEVGGPQAWDGCEDSPRQHHPGSSASTLSALSPRVVLPDTVTEQGWWSGPVEDEATAQDRGARLVAQLQDRHGGTDEVVALVSHEWFSQVLFCRLLGIERMQGWITFNNTGVSLFTDVDGTTGAAWVNRTTHLRPDQLTG